MDASEKIIVALDTNPEQARALARTLHGTVRWLKVGMTLYYAAGPQIVADFKEMGFNIFVDLKLHDIPYQVEGAARAIVTAGADMLTIHAVGGLEMMQAACRGAEEGFVLRSGTDRDNGGISEHKRPRCLAITVLTSLDAAALEAVGVAGSLSAQVSRMAHLATKAGMDGMVCSPVEVAALRSEMGAAATLVTPGVRPVGSAQGDQARVATPAQALEAGADYLVIGRPITRADYPRAAFEAIVREIQSKETQV